MSVLFNIVVHMTNIKVHMNKQKTIFETRLERKIWPATSYSPAQGAFDILATILT